MSVPRCSIDPLTKQVGVSVVPRVLLNHVEVDPAKVPGAFRMVPSASHHVVQRHGLDGRTAGLDLLSECLEIGRSIGVSDLFEVSLVLRSAVLVPDFLRCGIHTEPPSLDLNHVAYQPKQRQRRRLNGALFQLLRRQSGALPEQRFAMEVQPLLEGLPFVGYTVRPYPLDCRSGPFVSHMGTLQPT